MGAMRRISKAAVGLAILASLTGATAADAARKPTWIANATPAWSSSLSGFQASFFWHKRTLGIESPNWVTMVCTSADGSANRTDVGGFGLHLEKRRRPAPTHYGRKWINGSYSSDASGDVSVVKLPPGLPASTRVAVTFTLAKRSHSLKGKLKAVVEWADAASSSPYSRCVGNFKILPR